MDIPHLLLAIFLGVSLAASTGLNTFLPLFLLSLAARFHLGGVALQGNFAWIASDPATIALGIATSIEVIGDKVPSVDHALDVFGTFVRPVFGAAAFAAALGGLDLTTAALIGLIVGAPLSLGVHSAKATTRVASSATTLGLGNPALSVVEDAASAGLSLTGIFAPLLVPLALGLSIWGLIATVKALRPRPRK